MSDYGYRGYIVRALEASGADFTEDDIYTLTARFVAINGMVKNMNSYNPNKGLHSTQVMAKIVFDYLRERGND